MNMLLIFFALPIATILLSAVLEKVLNCPIAVSSVFFAIYLIATFSVFNVNFLIATIIYTILAFITAMAVHLLINYNKETNNTDNCTCDRGISIEAQNNTVTCRRRIK